MSPFSGQARGHSVVLSVVEPLFVSPGVASPLTDMSMSVIHVTRSDEAITCY